MSEVGKVGCGAFAIAAVVWGPWLAGSLFVRMLHPKLSALPLDIFVATWWFGVVCALLLALTLWALWCVGDIFLGEES